MFTKESLKEKLIQKLKEEYENFINEIKDTGVEYAIDKAYEISARQEIIDYINATNIEPKDIKVLLSTENILDDLYDEWLKTDGNFYEQLEYCIEDRIKSLSDEFYNKEDKDVEQENKSVKTQNKARDCR